MYICEATGFDSPFGMASDRHVRSSNRNVYEAHGLGKTLQRAQVSRELESNYSYVVEHSLMKGSERETVSVCFCYERRSKVTSFDEISRHLPLTR